MPYPNEHACRLRQPGEFKEGSFRRVTRTHEGKSYAIIMGRLKGDDTMTEQAYRYPKGSWSASAARAHCRSHDGKGFEPAGEGKAARACGSCREAAEADLAAEVARHRTAPAVAVSDVRVLAETVGAGTELFLYDAIGGWGGIPAGHVVEAVQQAHGRPLTVHINSPGGDVFDGLAIYNALREHDAPVTTITEGLAGSIASIIALGGHRMVMRPAAFYMIHDPHGVAIGGAARMRHLAALLDKAGALLGEVYAAKAGVTPATAREWMAAETWYTGAEALEAGFADELSEATADEVERDPVAFAARATFDLSAYQHVPAPLRRPQSAAPRPVAAPPRARERAATLAASLRYLVGT